MNSATVNVFWSPVLAARDPELSASLRTGYHFYIIRSLVQLNGATASVYEKSLTSGTASPATGADYATAKVVERYKAVGDERERQVGKDIREKENYFNASNIPGA